MKKIISTLTISALALGSIFADVSLEYTQKGYISSNEGGKSVKLDLNGYKDNITGDVVFKVSNDTAGVVLDVDPWYAEKSGDTTQVQAGGPNKEFFDQLYGWVNFFGGAAKLQTGVWKTRSVNRLNQDAGSWEDSEYEAFPLGVVPGVSVSGDNGKNFKIGDRTPGTDITRLASVKGEYKGNVTTALTYNMGSFYVTGALITSDFTSTIKSGFGFEVGYNVNDDTKIQGFFKTTADQEIALAVFLDKRALAIKNFKFDVVTGFTLDNGDAVGSFNGLNFAVDFRARSEITEKLAVTTMNNLSYVGRAFSLWDMVSAAFKLTETLKAQFTGEWYYKDLEVGRQGYLSVIPGVVYSPVDGVDITAGIIIRTSGWSRPTQSSISIPFVLHVAL